MMRQAAAASMQGSQGCCRQQRLAAAWRSGACAPAAAAATLRSRAAPRRAALLCRADKRTTGSEAVDSAIEIGSNLVNSAAGLVPDSVPRPIAKGGVAVAGGLIAFWLLQKVVSTVLTVALLGGAAWFYFQQQQGSGSGSSSSGSGGGGSARDADGDADDPLADARRIMNKYK